MANEQPTLSPRARQIMLTIAEAVTYLNVPDCWVADAVRDRKIRHARQEVHPQPRRAVPRLDQLTATLIGAHYRELETSGRRDKPGYGKPLSANTVSKVHVLLAAMLDAANRRRADPDQPAKKRRTVNPPRSSQVRAQKPEIVTWSGPQLQAFLTWNRNELNDELFPLWRTLAYTGMRRSEALTLRCSDINFTIGRISLRRAVDVTLPNTTEVTKAEAHGSSTSTPRPSASSRPTSQTAARSPLSLARADCYVFSDDQGEPSACPTPSRAD